MAQKNFRKVPDTIREEVDRFKQTEFIVAVAKKYTAAQVAAGVLSHLGVSLEDGSIVLPAEVALPPTDAGKYSLRNIEGREIKRTDLPMVKRVISIETPNFGDWSKGSHDIEWTRDVYQVEYEAPRSFGIGVELLEKDEQDGDTVFVLRFYIDAIFAKGVEGMEFELLYALNVMQENVGSVGVYPAAAKREDYLKTLLVGWEILPPGERDATVARVLSGFRRPTEEDRKRILERYRLLASLRPTAFIRGTSGFARYFGAQFAEDLVVFENVEYGNAIYVMFDDWQILSQQSRTDLLRGDTDKFVRIVHSGSWESQLRYEVQSRRKKR